MKTTTIEIDSDLIAKIRASLRAVKSRMTAEDLVSELLAELLTPQNDTFKMLIQPRHADKAPEMLAKLDRIRQGDKRLVQIEPLACNVALYRHNREAADEAAEREERSRNMLVNALVAHGLEELKAGRITFAEPQLA